MEHHGLDTNRERSAASGSGSLGPLAPDRKSRRKTVDGEEARLAYLSHTQVLLISREKTIRAK